MPSPASQPGRRRLILLGGGHTHLLALQAIASAAERHGIKVTMVCGDGQLAYSGMLPGFIAGQYSRRQIIVDVAAHARRCRVECIVGNAAAIDLEAGRVELESGGREAFDALSVNIGGVCTGAVADAGGDVMPVKPVLPFIDWLERWENGRTATCAVAGGGVAGAEMALAIDARLRRHGRIGGVFLVGANSQLIAGMPGLARLAAGEMARRGISQLLGSRIRRALPDAVELDDGSRHLADRVVVCSSVHAWEGLAAARLETDDKGFIVVNRSLQSVSHPQVFACGDCATLNDRPLPKSGVYAVRQAPVLGANVVRQLAGEPLEHWAAKADALAIINTGTGRALAHRGNIAAKGRLAWWLKEILDRRFMNKFPRVTG